MKPIVIKTTVDEHHRATIELPDVPPGEVELFVQIVLNPDEYEYEDDDLKDIPVMSDEEEEEFGRLAAGPRPAEDYVNEDREERC